MEMAWEIAIILYMSEFHMCEIQITGTEAVYTTSVPVITALSG